MTTTQHSQKPDNRSVEAMESPAISIDNQAVKGQTGGG